MLLLASLGCTPTSTRSASYIHDSTREWQNPFLRASVEAVVRLVTLSLFILRYDLLGTLRRAGIGKIECPPETKLEDICERMAQTPPWIKGLYLRADGFTADHYKKD